MPSALARVVDGDDVRVGQPGKCLDFPPEPLDGLRGLDERLRQQLHGDRAVHLAVDCLEDPPHPAAAKFLQQVVLAEGPVPLLLLGGEDARLADGLVCDFVRPAVEPVGRLQHPRPLPQPVGEVRRIPAQFLHAGLLPLLAQVLPAVEEVAELVVVSAVMVILRATVRRGEPSGAGSGRPAIGGGRSWSSRPAPRLPAPGSSPRTRRG